MRRVTGLQLEVEPQTEPNAKPVATRGSLPRVRTALNRFFCAPEFGYFNRKTAGLDTGGRCAIKIRHGSVNIREIKRLSLCPGQALIR
jgi:hypothetical protein